MKLRSYETNGYTYWRVDLGMVSGKRVQKQFTTKTAAETFLTCKRAERNRFGTHAMELSHDDRIQFMRARDRLTAVGATIDKAVDFFLKHQPKSVRTLSDAVSECIIAKRAAGRRERYVVGLESYLLAFIGGRGGIGVHEITTVDVEQWFVKRGEKSWTLASNIGRISALFSLCVRRGYCPANPCDAVERVRFDHATPKILSVADCLRLLSACASKNPKLLGYVSLCLFAGVRPEEAEKLDWKNVDLKNKRVVIDEKISKVRRRRIVDLPDCAIAWLSQCDRKGPLSTWKPDRKKKLMRALRLATAVKDDAGRVTAEPVEWCQDIMRHTAASHWMAKHKDAAFVADQLGNSPRVLLTNYRALVTPEEDAKFWSLKP